MEIRLGKENDIDSWMTVSWLLMQNIAGSTLPRKW